MNEKEEAARERAMQDVKMYMANDWQLKEETPQYFLLTRSKMSFGKHVIVFIITFWTGGLVNLLLHLFAREKKKIVK